MKIHFYTGPQCSLCDYADDEIKNARVTASLKIEKHNIREDQNLYHLYATRIPVLKRDDTGAELGWPFTSADVEVFVQ